MYFLPYHLSERKKKKYLSSRLFEAIEDHYEEFTHYLGDKQSLSDILRASVYLGRGGNMK